MVFTQCIGLRVFPLSRPKNKSKNNKPAKLSKMIKLYALAVAAAVLCSKPQGRPSLPSLLSGPLLLPRWP